MTFLKNNFRLRSSHEETAEKQEKRESRETKVLVYCAGVLLTVFSFFGFYGIFSEGIIANDFTLLIGSIVSGALAFLCFSPWKRTNYLIGGILVSSVGGWLVVRLLGPLEEEYFITLVWAVGI